MDMPKPTDGHRLFEKLAGTWVAQETMYPSPMDPAGGTAIGRTSSRVALGGFALIGDYEQERDGHITYAGHSVWTYEPQTNDYVMYWVDIIGMPGETFRGKLDGNALAVTSVGPHGHFRLTYDVSAANQLKSRMETSQDGMNWAPFFDSTATKYVPPPPPVPKAAAPKPKPAKKAPPKKAPPKKQPVARKAPVAKKKPPKKAKKRR